ncbi:hypothetical protein GGI42DRAFT_326869 [Trichoderma sp. SZMC 28013]
MTAKCLVFVITILVHVRQTFYQIISLHLTRAGFVGNGQSATDCIPTIEREAESSRAMIETIEELRLQLVDSQSRYNLHILTSVQYNCVLMI